MNSDTPSDQHFEKILTKFWAAMAQIYGRRWFNEYGDEPSAMWRGALENVPVEKIKITLEQCRDAGDEHPITLSLFMKRLRSIRVEQPKQKALPPKPVSQQHLKEFHEAKAKAKKPKEGIRSILLKGESYSDFLEKAALEIAKGKTMFEVKWERLHANGWTEEKELQAYNAARGCHYNLYNGTTNLLVDNGDRKVIA